MQIYLAGYSGHQPIQLKQAATALGATVVDVRLVPASRQAGWSRKRLSELLGDRYIHVRNLGNDNYKGGEVRIHDFATGVAIMEALWVPTVILLCVCADAGVCHRTTLAQQLRALGHHCEELDWRFRGQSPRVGTAEGKNTAGLRADQEVHAGRVVAV